MDIKILVAEDDDLFRDLVCDILKKEGYKPIEAKDGKEAIDKFFGNEKIDLVLLDVMMPKYNGWEVLAEIRERDYTPVIMLTALEDEKHEVKGFKIGADDYITKPFSYEVFRVRIKRFIDKIRQQSMEALQYGMIEVNQGAKEVKVNGIKIELNRKEYQLLNYLMKNKGWVLTREQLLDGVWGYDFDGDIRTVDAHIKMLRGKLQDANQYIKTIRGSGYKFEVDNNEDN